MAWLNWFLRPWAVAIAWLATVTSLIFGIWTYVDSRASRRLTYEIDGPGTQIVQTGQSSGLQVSFNGQPLASDVSANQVILWNAGKLPVRETDVLKPVVLTMEGGAPILEATLRASSRDVTAAALDTSELAKGRLGVRWRILEHDDGVRLQVIYAGSVSTKIGCEGVLEGQPRVERQASSFVSRLASSSWCIAIIGVGLALIVVSDSNKPEEGWRWWAQTIRSVVLLVLSLIGLVISLWVLSYLHTVAVTPQSLVASHNSASSR